MGETTLMATGESTCKRGYRLDWVYTIIMNLFECFYWSSNSILDSVLASVLTQRKANFKGTAIALVFHVRGGTRGKLKEARKGF